MTKAEIIESLIKEADLREWLAKCNNDRAYKAHAHLAKTLRKAAELLQSVPEWISVEDSLPSEAKVEKFLVAFEGKVGRTVEMARYMNGHLTLLAFEAPDDIITHWMPLPEPPKKEESMK